MSQAPASVSVIVRKQLAQRAYKDITGALRDVPGVTVTGGGYRQDISVRGLPAQYTTILVDGKSRPGESHSQMVVGDMNKTGYRLLIVLSELKLCVALCLPFMVQMPWAA